MDRLQPYLRRLPVWVVYLMGAIPLLWLAGLVAANDLGPDPAKTMERTLGEWALRFLLASLAISPLRKAGLNLLRFRRALGLLAFYYAALHLLVWLWPDMGFRWSQIVDDLSKRPYILLGTGAFLAMVPLALTSTNWAVRWMGAPAWRKLHRLAYAALALGLLHLVILTRTWTIEVLAYSAVGVFLLGLRLRDTALKFRQSPSVQP